MSREQQTAIDLTPFCAKEQTRYDMTTPWVKDGVLYATNSALLIAMPTGDPDSGDLDSRPNCLEITNPIDFSACTHPWPDTPFVRRVFNCETCRGEGTINKTYCRQCDGSGSVTCRECGHESDCKDCRGKGKFGGEVCPTCKGAEKIEQDAYQLVGGGAVDKKYVRLIQTLPGVLFSNSENPNKPIAFVFDGGKGLVCPLDPGNSRFQ